MRRMATINEQRPRNDSAASPSKRRSRVPVWAIVLVLAAALIALGVMQGDELDVWRKASLICYECIGIG